MWRQRNLSCHHHLAMQHTIRYLVKETMEFWDRAMRGTKGWQVEWLMGKGGRDDRVRGRGDEKERQKRSGWSRCRNYVFALNKWPNMFFFHAYITNHIIFKIKFWQTFYQILFAKFC